MGCASWRSVFRLREHAAIAPASATIHGRRSLSVSPSDVLGLNEVGVTDLVMAAVWRFGPNAAAYAVAQGAEHDHLGADIAILHRATSRILLHQAKLAHLSDGTFTLKSEVTAGQVGKLRKRFVVIQDIRYKMSGRLALYQADSAPFLHRWPHPAWWPEPWMWQPTGWHPALTNLTWSDRQVGRYYYEQMLAFSPCSPGGILSAPVPRGQETVKTIRESATLPWEFGTYGWLRKLDPPESSGLPGFRSPGQPRIVFGPYTQTEYEHEDEYRLAPQATGDRDSAAPGIARELAEQLNLVANRIKLYLIIL